MIKAFGKRIIVDVVDLEPKKGSLLLVTKDRGIITAKVIAFGSEVDKSIEVGDMLYLYPFTGEKVEINGHEYLSVPEDHVVAAWDDK